MNLDRRLTLLELHDLGFADSRGGLPHIGALLLCYHDVFGLTLGYWAGEDAGFLFPFVANYIWATHWRYHS